MASLTPTPKQQIFGSDGAPLVGGKIYTYAAGTTTPLATYTDAGAGTANTNPIILNSLGQANIWLSTASYKFSVYTSADVLLYTVDNISASLDSSALASALSSPTPIGNTAPNTGAFTTLTATTGTITTLGATTGTITTINATTANITGNASITGNATITGKAIATGGYQFADGNIQTYPIVSVRQTVQSGTVDSNGFSAFGGSTGSTTVTASSTLIANAANGMTNRTGSITNPSWTSLSTNGTMYLYLDIAADGTCTTGSTTLVPTYQFGGTYSITSLQNTFNIQEMTMKVGNGSTATQVYRVFVGEVTVSGAVVTAIVWYQLMRRYTGAWVATLPSPGSVSANCNIGTQEYTAQFEIECTTNDSGFVVGDRIDLLTSGISGTYNVPNTLQKKRNSVAVGVANGGSNIGYITPAAGGANTSLTAASWKYRFVCIPKF